MLDAIHFIDALTVSCDRTSLSSPSSSSSSAPSPSCSLTEWFRPSVLELRGSSTSSAATRPQKTLFSTLEALALLVNPPKQEEGSACLQHDHRSRRCLQFLAIRNNHTLSSLADAEDNSDADYGHIQQLAKGKGTSSDFLCDLRELVLNNVPLISSLEPIASQLVVVSVDEAGDETKSGPRKTQGKKRIIRESNLQTLFVRSNRVMKELPLLMPTSLTSLTLRDTVLTSIDGIARCSMLRELDISTNRCLCDLPESLGLGEHCPYLTRVNASQTKIASVDGLTDCVSLAVLVLDSTPHLQRLAKGLFGLKELYINYSGLADLSAIDEHPQLEVFEAAWNKELAAAPCLPCIRSLRLEGCSMLMELGTLHGNRSLQRLCIDHCRLVSTLPSFPSLEVLSAMCSGLTLSGLEQCFAGGGGSVDGSAGHGDECRHHSPIREILLRGTPAALEYNSLQHQQPQGGSARGVPLSCVVRSD